MQSTEVPRNWPWMSMTRLESEPESRAKRTFFTQEVWYVKVHTSSRYPGMLWRMASRAQRVVSESEAASAAPEMESIDGSAP